MDVSDQRKAGGKNNNDEIMLDGNKKKTKGEIVNEAPDVVYGNNL